MLNRRAKYKKAKRAYVQSFNPYGYPFYTPLGQKRLHKARRIAAMAMARHRQEAKNKKALAQRIRDAFRMRAVSRGYNPYTGSAPWLRRTQLGTWVRR